MISCFIDTPLGIAQIIGNSEGILSITIQDSGEVSNEIPKLLSSAVEQLQSYFRGEHFHFDFKLKPQGTEFQLRVWQ